MGVPVIATTVGGPAEIIEDGREGYLVAPCRPSDWARAIRRVADSPDGGAGMGRAGRSRAQEAFTLANHVRAIGDVYEHAMESARAGKSR